MNRSDKLKTLKEMIAEKDRILVAFSGGVDSGLLVKVARDTLGEDAFCIILDSETLPRSELKYATGFAEDHGCGYKVIKSSELEKEKFIKNTPDRCYYCKKEFARTLRRIASDKGIKCIADGVNISDYDEYRPGIKACDEVGIWHPFVEVGITKADIRSISKDIGLSTWDKPSSACLASRIPYGEEITKEKLMMIERSEEILKHYGFQQVRVRMHDGVARIEVSNDEMDRILDVKDEITNELKAIGFKYVALDLEGYRSGSMDEVL